MIGGLLSNTHNNSIDKAPFLGDLPVLGTLFRSNNFQRNETELVIVVTPYLVKPVDGNAIHLPTDGYKAATDAERILGGKLYSGKSGAERPKPRIAPPVASVPVASREAAGGTAVAANAPVAKPAAATKKGAVASAAPGFSTN